MKFIAKGLSNHRLWSVTLFSEDVLVESVPGAKINTSLISTWLLNKNSF